MYDKDWVEDWDKWNNEEYVEARVNWNYAFSIFSLIVSVICLIIVLLINLVKG